MGNVNGNRTVKEVCVLAVDGEGGKKNLPDIIK